MGRILAIDYGQRRVGLAVSDERGVMATGLETIDRRKLGRGGSLEEEIARLVSSFPEGIEEVVVGLPLNMDGTSGEAAREVVSFAGQLSERISLPVRTWDERLTTVAALRTRESLDLPLKRRRDKGKLDRMAAVILLSNYLVYLRHTAPGSLKTENETDSLTSFDH